MRVADRVTVSPALTVSGGLRVPGDKSISHRYALLAAIADGRSTIAHYAPGADCASTLACISALGAIVSRTPAPRDHEPPLVTIDGRGVRGLRAPVRRPRLRQFRQHDAHAGRRARRPSLLIDPDRRRFAVAPADAPHHRAARRRWAPSSPPPRAIARPSRSRAADLTGIHFTPDTPSAQVKSAVLLAGLQASGDDRRSSNRPRLAIIRSGRWRRSARTVTVSAGRRITPPGRPAADRPRADGARRFLLRRVLAVAAAAMPGSDVSISHVGLNPSRTALLEVLRRFGAEIERPSKTTGTASRWAGCGFATAR